MNQLDQQDNKSNQKLNLTSPFLLSPLAPSFLAGAIWNFSLYPMNPKTKVYGLLIGFILVGIFFGLLQWRLARQLQKERMLYWWLLPQILCGGLGGMISAILSLTSIATSVGILNRIQAFGFIIIVVSVVIINLIQRFLRSQQSKKADWMLTGSLGGISGGTLSGVLTIKGDYILALFIALLGVVLVIIHWFILRKRFITKKGLLLGNSLFIGLASGSLSVLWGHLMTEVIDFNWFVIAFVIITGPISGITLMITKIAPLRVLEDEF